MTARDRALVKLATVTVVCYSGVLTVVIVAALITRAPLAAAIAAVVAALSPLIGLGGVAIGRLGPAPTSEV